MAWLSVPIAQIIEKINNSICIESIRQNSQKKEQKQNDFVNIAAIL
jgi:hypothetical protein